jgi:hypothetical protein
MFFVTASHSLSLSLIGVIQLSIRRLTEPSTAVILAAWEAQIEKTEGQGLGK